MAGLMCIRVKALQPSRRRAGFAFTAQPVELTRKDFGGDGIEAVEKLLALVDDQQLHVVLIQIDGSEQQLTAEEIEALRDYAAAAKTAGSRPAEDPETASLIEELLRGGDEEAGSLHAADDDTSALATQVLSDTGMSEPDGAAQAAGEDASGPGAEAAVSLPVESITNTAPEASPPAGAETAAPAADAGVAEKGPSAAPAAGKPARKAKPADATEDKA